MTLDRSYIPPRAILAARKRMNDAVRRFFDTRGFLEVETPISVVSPGLEPHLEPFAVTEVGPDRVSHPLFLHTSPEYAMKKLLSAQTGSIYQIAHVFRNGERSNTHAPEFSLLEWYRQPGELAELMDDVEALIYTVADAVDGPWQPTGCCRMSISQAFQHHRLPDPIAYPNYEDFRRALGAPAVEGDTWDTLFHRAMLDRVEPGLNPSEVSLLYGYPASMAALARLDSDDPRIAERFEAYAGGLELGNAFGELSDPAEQRRRFEDDLAHRAKSGAPRPPIDEDLLAQLAAMGRAAGMAVGLDRLLMVCLKAQRVQDLIPFSPRDDS